jgi:hypothetical protein
MPTGGLPPEGKLGNSKLGIQNSKRENSGLKQISKGQGF